MASLGDEIDNCGLFLEQRRRHIFYSGKLSMQQPEPPENPESFLPKFSLSISWDSQTKSAHQSINLEQALDAAVQCIRAADTIAYTQTTCSTGAMPTPQSSTANTMDKPCSPTWQAFTPTQPHKPGNKN
jgi:hypothetical protein